MGSVSIWPQETERLRLRPLTVRDADALLGYRSLPEVYRYIPGEPMTAERIADRLAGRWASTESFRDGEGVVVGVARRRDDRVLGDLSLFHISAEHRGAELGWVLDPAHGGQGYATEAVHALLRVAFEVWGLHRVVARIDARNGPSLRLAERLGMRREAHLVANEWFKGEWSDEIDYALLDCEWAVRMHGRERPAPAQPPSVGTRSAIDSTIREGRKG
jgi:RimJ/RimL family protein N-acetyltransferase